MGVYGLPGTVKIWHFELTQDHLDTDVTEGMLRSLRLFCSQPQQYGCQQTPLDTNSQDLPFWADSGPPGHWLHQGHFFCSKFLQYGCLRTPLDPSNQDLAFWVDSGQPGHWGLRGLVEVTLLFLFQTPTIFSLDTSDQDLTFWVESGQPGHWGLRGYAEVTSSFFAPNPYNMGVYRLHWSQAIKIWHFELYQDNLDTEDSKGMQRSLCLFVPNPYNGCNCLWTPLYPSSQDSAFWADLQ